MIPGIQGIHPVLGTAGSTPPGGDPYWGNVVLLLGFEGADGSTTITDESPNLHGNAAISNEAQIDTAQFKFGASSCVFDGTNDSIRWGDSADWDFGAGQFTVECWVRFGSVGTVARNFLSQWQDPSNRAWHFGLDASFAPDLLYFNYTTDGTNQLSVAGNFPASTGTWYHFAADRDASNDLRIYADGVMIAKASAAGTIFNSSDEIFLGLRADDQRDFNGHMDEVRITKGIARYASDGGYTVPSAAFPRS
jgi:hypothetical protein